jgi:hypothetical protein
VGWAIVPVGTAPERRVEEEQRHLEEDQAPMDQEIGDPLA